MPRRLSAQRGQGLLLILAFVAAFLLVVWAALTLASAAFLNLNGTRRTGLRGRDQRLGGQGCRVRADAAGEFPPQLRFGHHHGHRDDHAGHRLQAR